MSCCDLSKEDGIERETVSQLAGGAIIMGPALGIMVGVLTWEERMALTKRAE